MQYPDIIHRGAIEGVTGSCHQLKLSATFSVLIDCGIFQGAETGDRDTDMRDPSGLGFSINTIKALIVTHMHADHVGRIPNLLAAGFDGPILCSEPSAKLLPLVLEDAFKFDFSRDEKQKSRDVALIKKLIIALPFNHWFNVAQSPELSSRIRLQRAGHILGSAYVEFDVDYPTERRTKRLVFSGDLGSTHVPFLPSPRSPERADLLVLESTYGDRQHEDRGMRILRLEAVIDKALRDRGTVLIPAFSIGRIQELLYEIEDIIHRKALNKTVPAVDDGDGSLPIHWPELPVIVDSPLASRFTESIWSLMIFGMVTPSIARKMAVSRCSSISELRSTAMPSICRR
jgi:metallo-beta-lactamase family protein